jgi:hypothetical protein
MFHKISGGCVSSATKSKGRFDLGFVCHSERFIKDVGAIHELPLRIDSPRQAQGASSFMCKIVILSLSKDNGLR